MSPSIFSARLDIQALGANAVRIKDPDHDEESFT